MSTTTVSVLLLLASSLAIVHCSPIKGFEERLTNRIHFGSSNHFENIPESDYMSRQVRKDSNQNSGFGSYIMMKTPPPMQVVIPANSKYVLECEVSGSPKPGIYWTKNGIEINQTFNGESGKNETPIGQMSLSLVKSRYFIDCMPENVNEINYSCNGNNGAKVVQASTKVIIGRQALQLDETFFNKEGEFFANQNSIDLAGKPGLGLESTYALESTLIGCLSKKSLGSPARIYFWTVTVLENIGSDAVISCRAIGYPRPSITWIGSNNQLIETDFRKYKILESGDLIIRNVTFDDMGKYQCVASNQYGSDTIDKIFFYPTEPVQTSQVEK